MKKVLMFLDYYNNGGIEKVVENIIESLNNRYYFQILSFVNIKDKNESLLKKEYRNFFLRNIRGIFVLKRLLKKNNYQYDIIHIHCYNSFGYIYASILKKYTNKIIMHAHNSGIDYDILGIKKMINFLIKKKYRNSSFIRIACSEEAGKFCFTSSFTIIPNGIDYDKYSFSQELREKYRTKYNFHGKKIIAQVGRLEIQKNHLFLLKVFSDYLKTNPNSLLIIIGNGSQKDRILLKIKELKLEKSVLLFDYITNLSDILNSFDIVVLPSLYEGFGLIAVEAQVNGRMVLVSNHIPKSVIISNHIKMIPLDEKIWYSALCDMQDKKLKVKKDLSNTTFIRKIEKTYNRGAKL